MIKNKIDLARFSVLYAANFLGIEGINVSFKPSSFFEDDSSAVFFSDDYHIVFSEPWVNQAHFVDILYCGFHETRHAYQRACIDFQYLINYEKKELNLWINNFKDYSKPGMEKYNDQPIEKDADEFSIYLLKRLLNQIDR